MRRLPSGGSATYVASANVTAPSFTLLNGSRLSCEPADRQRDASKRRRQTVPPLFGLHGLGSFKRLLGSRHLRPTRREIVRGRIAGTGEARVHRRGRGGSRGAGSR